MDRGILLRLPNTLAAMVATGAEMELIQAKPADAPPSPHANAGSAPAPAAGKTQRMLHIYDEAERLARRQSAESGMGSARLAADAKYLDALAAARRTLFSQKQLQEHVLVTEDHTLWPPVAVLESVVAAIVLLVLERDTDAKRGLALRAAFELHKLELSATGIFPLAEATVSDHVAVVGSAVSAAGSENVPATTKALSRLEQLMPATTAAEAAEAAAEAAAAASPAAGKRGRGGYKRTTGRAGGLVHATDATHEALC